MQLIKIFFMLSLFSFTFSSFAYKRSIKGREHLVNGCKVYSLDGALIKIFPGNFCVFLDNGDFVSLTETTIKYFKKDGAVEWMTSNPFFHHQINISHDKKDILAMGSVEKNIDGAKYRVDQFFVYDIATGKLKRSQDSDVVLRNGSVNPTIMTKTFPTHLFTTSDEYTHFNSFHEIPQIETSKKLDPSLTKGKYIINSVGLGLFILDSNLEKVLKYHPFKQAIFNMVHDVQVTKRGTITAFINSNRSTDHVLQSAVIEMDLLTTKNIVEIKSSPPSLFYSRYCGGVQDLDGEIIFFSHNYAGVYAYDTRSKKIIYTNDTVFKEGDKLVPSQQIRIDNLTLFLKNNQDSVF